MFLGDRRSRYLFLFLLGYSNHKPQPLPYSLYEGEMYTLPRVYPMAIDVAEAN